MNEVEAEVRRKMKEIFDLGVHCGRAVERRKIVISEVKACEDEAAIASRRFEEIIQEALGNVAVRQEEQDVRPAEPVKPKLSTRQEEAGPSPQKPPANSGFGGFR